jgi:hypothetical protein
MAILREVRLFLSKIIGLVYLLTLPFNVVKLLPREMGESAVGTKNAFSSMQKSFAGFFL